MVLPVEGSVVVPAQQPAAQGPAEVAGVQQELAPAAVAPAAQAPTGVLPATGAEDDDLLLLTGVGMLAVGGLLLSRRRTARAVESVRRD